MGGLYIDGGIVYEESMYNPIEVGRLSGGEFRSKGISIEAPEDLGNERNAVFNAYKV